jgi:hypothetical protein
MKVSIEASQKRVMEAKLEKRVLKVKNQELEMQVFQVETIKFIVKTMVKRVNNVELKLTTLSEKLKKEQQSHACTTT